MRGTGVLRDSCITGAALMWTACSSVTDANRPAVASVTLTPSSSTVAIGSSIAFQATVKDADGRTLDDREVFWASENPAVAEVTSTPGVFRALSVGTTRIAASSERVSGIAMLTVSVRPVASVIVLPAVAELRVGFAVQLRAIAYDDQGNELAGRAVAWASSNPAVATVDDQGNVTGVATGNATISAASEGKSGSAAVTILGLPVDRVEISPSSADMVPGGTQQFIAHVYDRSGNELLGCAVTWESSDTEVLTIDAAGLATARERGRSRITARCEDESGEADVRVRHD